jgi:hypothetical protein
MIGSRANDTDLDAIFRVPTREAVETIKALTAVEIVAGTLAVDGKYLRLKRNVY